MVVVVEIEDRAESKKPFLGGWRNVATSQEYHNAKTQTDPRDMKFSNNRKNIGIVKSTQTVDIFSRCIATVCNKATQLSLLPSLQDKLLQPKLKMFRSKEQARKEEESASRIQKFYRSYRQRKFTRELARFLNSLEENSNRREKLQRSRVYNGIGFKMIRPQLPRSKADFDIALNVLDRWRISEIERMNRDFFQSSKLVAQDLILAKEVEFLRVIDTAKSKVKKSVEERREFEFLEKLAKPECWKSSDGRVIYVQTPQVQEAKEYRKLYESLVKAEDSTSIDTRIDLLVGLKRIAKEHSCQVSRDLEYLIDQELDLLSLHVDVQMLDQLRNRLKLTFLRLVRSSLHLLDYPDTRNGKSLIVYGQTRICKSCGRLRDMDHFSLDYRQRISFCDNCVSLQDGNKILRIVYEPFERILRDLRRREAQLKAYGSLAFVVDFKVIYHLVNDIWHGKSAITECNDLDKLQLVRFRQNVEWSPWNSLVLTRREALVHEAVVNLFDVYDSSLVQKFHARNLQARLYFDSITNLQKQSTANLFPGNIHPTTTIFPSLV